MGGVENGEFPLTKPVAVNTELCNSTTSGNFSYSILNGCMMCVKMESVFILDAI